MDECDGMSSGDRGGNLALIQLIKITKVILSTLSLTAGPDNLYLQ